MAHTWEDATTVTVIETDGNHRLPDVNEVLTTGVEP
jgi:hypothetical protein